MKNLEDFENRVNKMWKRGMATEALKKLPHLSAFIDRRLVAIYLTQVYHYAVHTPRHQALVAVNVRNNNFKYMQYCFEHAFEETGHELMALNDIRSLGFDISPSKVPDRLPSTDKLISFLYEEANGENPIHHLGYGFWSENACPFIGEFMASLMKSMDIKNQQMTFYRNHVSIDEDHAKDVRKIINDVAKTESDWEGMHRVAERTFKLTIEIVNESIEAYEKLMKNESDLFQIFREIKN